METLRLAWHDRRVRTILALSFFAVACSGATSKVDPQADPPGVPAQTTNPTTPPPDPTSAPSAPGVDAGSPADASTPLEVHDRAAPECHDLTQRATMVVTKTSQGSPPEGTPLTTPPSGLYVATELVEWELPQGAPPSDPPSRTTVFVTPKKWYYLTETASARDVVTASWRLEDGWLVRDALCRSDSTGLASYDQPVYASPNGFTVVASSRKGNPLTVRYEKR